MATRSTSMSPLFLPDRITVCRCPLFLPRHVLDGTLTTVWLRQRGKAPETLHLRLVSMQHSPRDAHQSTEGPGKTGWLMVRKHLCSRSGIVSSLGLSYCMWTRKEPSSHWRLSYCAERSYDHKKNWPQENLGPRGDHWAASDQAVSTIYLLGRFLDVSHVM